MTAHLASCDRADIAHVELELARNPGDIAVGVIDTRTGQIRLFSYDETNAFSRANRPLQVGAGHEAAAAMAGIPADHVRGFLLHKQARDWEISNQSHLNVPDGQSNSMQMNGLLFVAIVSALQRAGIPNLVVR